MAKEIKGKTISPNKVSSKTYKVIGIEGFVKQLVGDVPWGFSALVVGSPKQGKSTLMMKVLKELLEFGKCYYVSSEMNEGKALQDMVKREGLTSYKSTQLAIGLNQNYDQMVAELEKNRAVFVVIDSLDWMNITKEQFDYLKSRFPNKCFFCICWEGYGGKPRSESGKAIGHMVDVVINVCCGLATSLSRFGSTEPYVIIPQMLEMLEVRRAQTMGVSKHKLQQLKELHMREEE